MTADRAAPAALAALSDGTEVSIGYADEWVDTDSVLHVATPSDAHRWLARRGPSWVSRHGAALQCEIEQYATAKSIGVAAEEMCIRLRRVYGKPTGMLTRRWYGADPELLVRFRGPKLAIAAIYGAPRQPTPFDVQRVIEFGYASIDDLAARVAEWNAAGRDAIPMPLGSAA